MRRSLVLVDETARHPFLRSLPPHVRAARAPLARVPQRDTWLDNTRHFLLAYCSCFIAASLYFA